ncbi:adenylate/guanylate cyclase domain-containing protein [Actinokineospora fastidiosa]|uniref:Guanylate cyclase n=1 Tax=Actinokineospora fastidiosa TaxID=1816 RepID=A0A918GLX9_9PSEU|nr:adenylate/guanylate cyclase domain-containing protein [Actinokineospora fastidiosa]GGS44154.1 guanylate cyclase [Actinokineospora fastidiosa]
MTCASCAADLAADARFCSRCGTAVVVRPKGAEERKVVSVVFCDLAGSTEMSGALDPELLRTVLLRYYELMSGVIAANGGVVEKFIGDAVMAVFGLTETREDDARRALVAALGMTEAAAGFDAELRRDHGVRLRVRIGVHTGEVVALPDPGERQAFVSGEVVNIAARLEQAAGPGEVLVSAAARSAAGAVTVADPRRVSLKGVAEPVEVFRLVDVPPADPERTRRFDVPFIGREADLAALDAAWRRVVDEGAARLLTLVGEPGIGKTRLVAEWLRRDTGSVVIGRCRPVGDGGTLTALAECVAPLVYEVERVASVEPALALLRRGLLRDGTPAPSLDATAAAVARLLAAVAGTRPVLLVIDDCQWAQPSLVAVLDRLLAGLGALPVLLVCVARPDLLDAFPDWETTWPSAETAVVGRLSAPDSARLAAHFADVSTHDTATTEWIVAQAGGNPLYLEQLVAAVEHDDATAGGLPLSLQALVAARIDRLGDAERSTLRLGAVVDPDGDGFAAADLAALADGGDHDRALRELVRRKLVEPVADGRYRIANGITSQVAYRGLTKRRRGELHERYAEHLAARAASDALIGTHLAQAHRYQSAVGLPADTLRSRAFGHLDRAGAEALRRVDLPWALTLLEQAADLTTAGDPGRPECLQRLGEVHLTLGRHEQAREAFTTAAAEADRPVTAAHARLHLAMLRQDMAELDRVAAEEFDVFHAHGDDLGLSRVRCVLARSHQRRGEQGRALNVLEPALRHALAAAADREVANALGAIGLSLWHGPLPAARATEQCRALLAAHRDRGAVQATLGFALTMLHAIQARTAETAAALADAQEAMAAMSYAESRFFRPLLGALVAAHGDDWDQARWQLREALSAASAVRADSLVRQTRLELARVHLADDDTRAAAELVRGLAVDDCADLANLLGVAARVEPDPGRATELARRAVATARRTDSPADHGRALLDLAHTHARLGRPVPALSAARAAERRFAAKGHAVGSARARRMISELGGRPR